LSAGCFEVVRLSYLSCLELQQLGSGSSPSPEVAASCQPNPAVTSFFFSAPGGIFLPLFSKISSASAAAVSVLPIVSFLPGQAFSGASSVVFSAGEKRPGRAFFVACSFSFFFSMIFSRPMGRSW